MKLMVKESLIKNLSADVLVIPVFSDVDNNEKMFLELDNILNKLLTRTIYENKQINEEGKMHLFYATNRLKLKRVLLAGLGKVEELDAEKIRLFGGKLAAYCKANSLLDISFLGFGYNLKNVAIDDASKAFIEGFLLGNYSYAEFKTEDKKKQKK